MGQGLVGLLVTNLLRANGARVMAVDLAAARKRRFCESDGRGEGGHSSDNKIFRGRSARVDGRFRRGREP